MSEPTREQVVQWAKEGADISVNAGTVILGYQDISNICKHARADLEATIAEQAAEIERLKEDKATAVEKMHESANQFVDFMHGPHSKIATELARTRQQLAAEQAYAEQLREAFISLMRVVPKEVDCGNMHHKRSDQHGYDETCPVVSKYAEAIETADKVLSSTNPTTALQEWGAKMVEMIVAHLNLRNHQEYFGLNINDAITAIADKIRKGEF